MAHVSRRGLLLGGGLALGAAATAPISVQPAAAAGWDPAVASMDVRRFGDPQPFATMQSLGSRSSMQDVVYEPDNDWLFVSQATSGSNGSRSPYETTVISRVRRSDGALLDSMRLVDAGHGLGFEVEAKGARIWVWTTWQGSGYDFVRLRYRPGTWERGEAGDALDLTLVAFQHHEDNSPEAVYHFDQGRGVAVERQFHWSGGRAASETYYRRGVSDLVSGSSASRGAITLPATPPQVQGFATVGGSLFRLLGTAATGGRPDPGNPIQIEQYSWATGRLVARRDFPDLATDSGPWKDGICEPEGLSVYRDADGDASMLIGATTGDVGRREYHVLRFANIA